MARQLKRIILIGLFSFFAGCMDSKTNGQQPPKLVGITSRLDHSEGWSNIFLTITSDTKTDTSHLYIVKGLHKGKTVGFEIEVSSNIRAGIIEGKPDGRLGFVANGVRLKSMGLESDAFVKALAELYKQPSNKGFSKLP